MKMKIIPAVAMAIAFPLFAFAAEPVNPAPALADTDVVAVLDGEKISYKELTAELSRVMAQRGMPVDSIPVQQRPTLEKLVLENMIAERLLEAASKDTVLDEKDFEAEMKKITDARGDLEKFAQSQGITGDKMKGELRRMMRQRKWVNAQLEGRMKEISDAEAKEFYDKNPQYFMMPEQVRASHILFMVDQTAPPEKVTEALKKAEAATKRAATEDFAKLAGELSEEPGAKERGGDLNFFPRSGAMVEPFAAAAFALKKGEVSKEPVRSQFGYHVIKVTDRKDATKNTFEDSKQVIKDRQNWDRKRSLIDDVIAELRAKAKVTLHLPEPPAPKTEPVPVKRAPIEAVTPPVSAPPLPAAK